MPWFISPSLKKGLRMYGLLSSQVLIGEGRSGVRFWLTKAQRSTTSPIPTKGSKNLFHCCVFFMLGLFLRLFDVVDRETLGVLLGLRRIEFLAVEEGFLFEILL